MWADRIQLLSDTSEGFLPSITHASIWLGECGRIVFGSYLCLRFSSQSTSLHQMRACMFLLQYHSISLHYLRETTKNKERLVEFREKAQNVNKMAGSYVGLRLWLCLHTEACFKAVTMADNTVINLYGGIYYIYLAGYNRIHFLSGTAGHQSIITSSKHTRPPQYNPSNKEPRKWLAQCIMRQCLS